MFSHRFQHSHLQKPPTASAQHFSTLTPDTFPLHRHLPPQAQESRRKHSHRESSAAFRTHCTALKLPFEQSEQKCHKVSFCIFRRGMSKLCCMECEEGELPNPSTDDSSRQRSGGEVLRGNGPHKNSATITPPPQQHTTVGQRCWCSEERRTAAFPAFLGLVFASFPS